MGNMDSASPKTSSLVLSPFSSPTVRELLRKRIISWSQETGLPVSVHVRVGDNDYNLHMDPLLSKSGYFKKALAGSLKIDLSDKFPGGSEIFEMVALFSYGAPLTLDPFIVGALRCAAEFLEMVENYSTRNLCEHSDLYLNQVVLQNWDDTLIVLQKCQALLPWAEDVLIVSRCVESLAFMACMEILDPEQQREKPIVTLQSLAGQPWNCETVKDIAGQKLWIKDLIALPFVFFERIIGSLRRQGMEEKFVCPIIVFYASKWALSRKTHQFWENLSDKNGTQDANNRVLIILQGIIDLLPIGDKASKVIPVGFFFALLSRSLNLGLSHECEDKLLDQISSMLHLARIHDLLLPEDGVFECIALSKKVDLMQRIFSTHLSSNSNRFSVVADLWDEYLLQIAFDLKLSPGRFTDLIEVVSVSDRRTHDHLYKAMNTFLLEHPHISQEERASVCKYLNCQKLSQETRIQAVQNEQMPLRLIIQALFVQQLNTHQAFKDCSECIRYGHSCELSDNFPSSRYQQPNDQTLGESPYKSEDGLESVGKPLGFLLQKDLAMQRSEFMKDDLECTSFRIQTLEQELMSLKKSLQWKSISKGSEGLSSKTHSFRLFGLESRRVGKKGNPLGQVGSCIGSVGWPSQRKYANRLLKVFQRIVMFGREKSS